MNVGDVTSIVFLVVIPVAGLAFVARSIWTGRPWLPEEAPPFWTRQVDPEVWKGIMLRSGPAVSLMFACWVVADHWLSTLVGWILAFIGCGFAILWVSIYYSNRPRFLVPPRFRSDPGAWEINRLKKS